MKATEQYFPVVMFIIDKQYQRKVLLSSFHLSTVQGGSIFLFVDYILKCYHSDEGYWAEQLSCGILCYA